MKKNKLKRPRTDKEMAKAYADAWNDDKIDEEFRKGVHSKEMLDRLDAYIDEQLNKPDDRKEEN